MSALASGYVPFDHVCLMGTKNREVATFSGAR